MDNCVRLSTHGVACDSACPLKETAFCADAVETHIGAGVTLFEAGAAASAIYLVRAGMVKLVKYPEPGGKRIVRLIGRDGIVGVEGLFFSSRQHSAVAVTDVVACRISAADFQSAIEASATVQRRVLECVHRALTQAEDWLCEFAGNARSLERMARLLLRLRDGADGKIRRLCLEDMSSLLGVALETACRNLSDLMAAGVLVKREASRHYDADLAKLKKIAYRNGS